MTTDASAAVACPLCHRPTPPDQLAEAGWMDAAAEARVRSFAPQWRRSDGACPACVQEAVLTLLLEKGEGILGDVVQRIWPLDAEAAFGALPTPLRMRADPRFTGEGVTIAVVDAAFHPHDDLVQPRNRIRAWVDATHDTPVVRSFTPEERPTWPGLESATAGQWHGTMTSSAVAGNGCRSHGLYRGLASRAELVVVQVQGADGHIGAERVARALRWILAHHAVWGIRVVNVSLGTGTSDARLAWEIDDLIAALVDQNVVVVVASGNDGDRSLAIPATAPAAITVGGLDDHNVLTASARDVWHSNFGSSSSGMDKPELVAPSIWIVAPLLPGTPVAHEAHELFARRAAGDASVEPRIHEARLVTPWYQHVEGTSFAAPIVSGVVACMLEAHPELSAHRVKALLEGACFRVTGASPERQGAGAIDAGRAVALALATAAGASLTPTRSPRSEHGETTVYLQDFRARSVMLLGSWDQWRRPGIAASVVMPGLWSASPGKLQRGRHSYKLLVDDTHWLADPANPAREHDGQGGWNSVLEVR